MNTITTFHDPSTQGTAKAGKRERTFELSLPALVKGLDATGRRFEQRTQINSISAQEVSFKLKSPVVIGAKVTLAMDIPRTLILEKPLRLLVKGAVVHACSAEENGKNQLVTVRLDRSFRLHPDTPEPF